MAEIRRLTRFACQYEDEFVKVVSELSKEAMQSQINAYQSEVRVLIARDKELDRISIDGFTPETNATRISPVFNCEDTTRKILQGLDCLLSCGNDVSTICVLSKINVEYVKEYLNECANRGISLISMNPIIKLGRSLLNENLLLSNSQIIEAYIKVIEQLNKLLSEGKV